MEGEKVFIKDYCTIVYNMDKGIIYAKWSGFLSLSQVEEGCEIINDYVSRYSISRHLSDHRMLKVLTADVQDYLTGTFFPTVKSLGLKKIAVIVSENVFAKATVDKVNAEALIGQLSIHNFMHQEQCIEWLMNEKLFAQ
jgi:hypothetical protein